MRLMLTSFSLVPTRAADARYGKHALAGGCGGSGCAPPMPAVAAVDAGTEPRRRRGGVRLMLNRVN